VTLPDSWGMGNAYVTESPSEKKEEGAVSNLLYEASKMMETRKHID